MTWDSSYDRYRKALKGTWKDEPRAAAGLTYDLGAHLIDQALVLFGRPSRVTGFIKNLRGVGDPSVDDSVRTFIYKDKETHSGFRSLRFTCTMTRPKESSIR